MQMEMFMRGNGKQTPKLEKVLQSGLHARKHIQAYASSQPPNLKVVVLQACIADQLISVEILYALPSALG